MSNVSLIARYKQWRCTWDGKLYRRMRFTDDVKSGRGKLDSYFVGNIAIGYKAKLGKQKVDLSFSMDNMFDKDYQNEKYYAMPGRSFRFSISTDLNIINHK